MNIAVKIIRSRVDDSMYVLTKRHGVLHVGSSGHHNIKPIRSVLENVMTERFDRCCVQRAKLDGHDLILL